MSQESAPKGTYLFASIFLKTLPVLVSAFFGQLSGLVNSILTGHYDTADLAAVSFGFLFMMTVSSVAQGMLAATIPFLQEARHSGPGEFVKATNNAKWILIFSMIFVAAIYLLAITSLGHFDYAESYRERVHAYLKPIGLFMLVILVFSYNINLLVVIGKTKPIALFGFTATSLDVLTSSLLVFGLFGLPALGAMGAATGTLIGGLAISLISSFYLTSRCKLPENYRFWTISKPNWHSLKQHLVVGLPFSILSFLSWGSIFTLTAFLSTVSTVWVAANQIVLILSTLALVVVNSSINITANSLVESRLGGESKQFKIVITLCLGFSAVSFLLGSLIALFFLPLAKFFGGVKEVLELASPLSLPFLFFVVTSSFNATLRAALLSIKKTNISLFSQICSFLALIISISSLEFFQHLSLSAIWWCLCLERVIQILLNLTLLKRQYGALPLRMKDAAVIPT